MSTAIEIVQAWAAKTGQPHVVEACVKAERLAECEELIKEIGKAKDRGWQDDGSLLSLATEQLIEHKKYFNL